jgi:hypothetical protein
MASLKKTRTRPSRMTGKERLSAALRFQDVDRVPWAPKVFIGHYRRGTAPALQKMPIAQFADTLNCDAIGWDRPVTTKHHRNVTIQVAQKGRHRIRTVTTPVGVLRSIHTFSPEAQTYHPTEYPLKRAEDYKVAQFVSENTSYEPCPSVHDETLRSVGDRGIVMSHGLGTPFMELLQGGIGIPGIYYHMEDHADAFADLYAVESDRYVRFYEAYAQTGAEYVVTHENTSSSLVSPAIYRTYCLPLKKAFCRIMRDAGKMPILHMCGTLRQLLPLIDEAGADAWESFTPPPNGDTTFADGRRVAGERVCLVGGLNAVMLAQWSEDRLYRYVRQSLNELPHTRGLIFTSGGAMPVECPVERLASIGRGLKPILNGSERE